ncbi:L,D-transpeptidase family protein [Microbacterium sp.]|uniref:L,D-transpeptidase family protein n=1 Tax=Microbacterium sp. TaxID=51671 RepID=UPI0028116BD8|nr:L,D-transpeptidase family protein [Microbacterium sp.]
MTDVATKPEGVSDGSGAGDSATSATTVLATGAQNPDVQWAQADPPKKRHLGAWLGFGIPFVLILAAAVVASLVLIGPGVKAAGASVGLMTPGMAAETVSSHLADTEFEVGGATLTGEQLGLSIDAGAVADQAHETYPAWNIGGWGQGEVSGPVTIDADTAAEALRTAVPDLYSESVNAEVVFDSEARRFTTTPGEPGLGVDVEALGASITEALAAGPAEGEPIAIEPVQSEVEPAATTDEATAFATKLNDQADTAGFYLQDERAHGLPLTTVQSWMDIAADPESGEFVVTPDMGAIEEAIKDLPKQVNQDVVNEEVVTNSAGDRLHVVQEGQDGFGITSTDGVADGIAESLKAGDVQFELQGEVVKFETVTLFRRVEVDKSAGMTYMYEGPAAGQEKLVASYPVAFGKPGFDTQTGHFTVYGQLTQQNMGSCTPDGKLKPGGSYDYCTPNVKWVSYFNGDQGFHGTYWHSSFGPGNFLSHGCVNMTEAAAEHMYRFAQVGTEVWVHD